MTFFTGDKISKANCGEGNNNKVDWLKRAPALDVLEDDGWQGHKDETAKQDEEQRGDDADLCLADFPLLWWEEKTNKPCLWRERMNSCDEHCHDMWVLKRGFEVPVTHGICFLTVTMLLFSRCDYSSILTMHGIFLLIP